MTKRLKKLNVSYEQFLLLRFSLLATKFFRVNNQTCETKCKIFCFETEGFEPSIFRIKNECLSIWLCLSEKRTTYI